MNRQALKLNVGCGYNRLEGWVNLDRSPESAADRLMEAHYLDFPDGSAAEIRALQLVEHLGFFKTKYFLSECWRSLACGGPLLLETPHIERTFELFLAGDHRAKEAALGWIFGPETEGMGHAYCFPKELLSELLAEAGFEAPPPEEFMFQPGRPALRYRAVKREGERAALNSALRRRLLAAGVARFGDEETSAGLELAVRRLVAGGGRPGEELEQALVSAPAALEYFTLAGENEQRPSKEAAACARLAAWSAQGRMAAVFLAGLEGGSPAEAAYDGAVRFGRELISAALAGGDPPGPGPAAGAPPVFTRGTASAWAHRRRFAGPAKL